MSGLHSHQSITWILQGCSIFSIENSLPSCLSYHFPFKGEQMAKILLESSIKLISWTSSTAYCFFISLPSSPLFYQDRWMCCVFILHFPSFYSISAHVEFQRNSVHSLVKMQFSFLCQNKERTFVTLGHAAELSARVLRVTRWNWSFTSRSKLSQSNCVKCVSRVVIYYAAFLHFGSFCYEFSVSYRVEVRKSFWKQKWIQPLGTVTALFKHSIQLYRVLQPGVLIALIA